MRDLTTWSFSQAPKLLRPAMERWAPKTSGFENHQVLYPWEPKDCSELGNTSESISLRGALTCHWSPSLYMWCLCDVHIVDTPWLPGVGGLGGLVVEGPMEWQSERQILGGYHSQGTAVLNIAPVFLWNRPTYLSWSFRLRGRLQVCHTSGVYSGSLREQARGCPLYALSLPCYSFLIPPIKELIHLSGGPIFAAAIQRTLSDSLLWMPAGFTIAVSQDNLYLHTWKAAARASDFQVAWN